MKKITVSLLVLASLVYADTGFKDTIQFTEADGSPKCMAGQVKVGNGQLTCSGQTATLTITGGGGGGSSTLQVTRSGVEVTSPTASINFNSQGFSTGSSGTTAYISINPSTTDFIHNQITVQTATLNITSGSFNTQLNTPYITDSQSLYSSSGIVSGISNVLVRYGNAILNLNDTVSPYSSGDNYGIKFTGTGGGVPTNLYGIYSLMGTGPLVDAMAIYGRASGSRAGPNYGGWFSAYGGGSNYGVWVDSGQVIINSSVTIRSGFAISSGTYLCGSAGVSGQAFTSAGPGQCPTWTTPSGSGASTLAVTTGAVAGFATVASSPTAVISFDQSQLSVTLQGGATAFITIAPAISTPTANFTFSSTSTVANADASGGSFTVTLPTAVGISGKVFTVKRTSSGANTVTIGTTSSQTIDGDSTVVLTSRWASIDIISDGANWGIK